MRGCIRQRLGPTRKRLEVRIEQTQTFLQQATLVESESKANELLLKLERNLKSYKELLEQLQEASKDDEAKTQRLESEMEEFSILELDGEEAICDLKLLLANITKRKRETTEKEEKQRERVHQKETSNRKTATREGPSPGKTEPRERASDGKDEIGIGNVETE